MRYEIRRSKRVKRLRITVRVGGDITVTAPERASLSMIEGFVERHDEWIHRALARVRKHQVITVPRRDIPRLKKRALALARRLVEHYAARYGFEYKKITIRAQRSRWGSCSKAGNISINYKIAALPIDVATYVIVHEVCHLGELNHSQAFWGLVEQEVPRHRELRKQLNKTVFAFT